jgi:hypothetical protein
MEIQSKIQQLQNAWLNYIALENLCNAQVDAGSEEQPRIWEKEIRLLGDQLLLGESLFNELQSQVNDDPHKGKKEELQIAAAFPQLYVISSGSRQFRPLFTLNISSIFTGKYRKRGWDLTEFEFQPVLPNLMEWYGVEEEEAETLVTQEGLKVFLENTFGYPFETLQDFVDYLEVPPHPVRSKPSPYLLNFGYVPFNHNLKKDLVKINQQPQQKWATPGHPAYEYLFGTPPSPEPSLIFLGAFPTFPPDDEQATALKHSLSHPLTAVIGPPGNGKTTLLLHKIAQQVVKRAVQSLTEGGDESNLTLVTSTNNRAVENVEALLAEKSFHPFFFLSGGSQELVSTQVFPKLQAAVDYLRETPFQQEEWEAVQAQLLAKVQKFQSDFQQEERYPQQKAADEQLLAQYQV